MTSPQENHPKEFEGSRYHKLVEFDEVIRKYMVLILSYVDNINSRSINMQKEMNRLKYLLELKKAKRLSQKTDDVVDVEAEQKRFQTKRKMYVGKLNKQEIKAPKLETLRYYNLQFDEETNTYAMLN
jgi:hypothetical protein